ncbi:MAG TPA: Ig-like domain-containing protein [Archangium sp.]|uniref:adventurous gliding motility protein AgmC n=1 Tax=Archangium sp. TaxID=1872627 RepID=UPI002E30F9B1|nr:Ig-like domain-containing protein [Archangium sp.]HEX5750797.1 Ig-like domain-containing protein [Archangium sp.]
MKTWLAAAVCVLALGSSAALAEADTVGVGTGRNLALSVDAPNTVINSYAPVTAALAAGSTSIPIGTCTGNVTCFTAGDLVLVHQTTSLVKAATPEPVDITTASEGVARWEFARLAEGTTTATLELTAPLVRQYAANVTQVIRVPEYTNVTIASTGIITAPAWDGSTGGIVAFLANATVNNNGVITASALGFRGGQYVNDATGASGCAGTTALDQPAPSGAQKGEGIVNTRYGTTQTGRGNVANGAGGGVCVKSGGGGGGHGGVGGQGGRSSDGGRDVGGLGGAALTYEPLTQWAFGGGGGAGHGTNGTGVPGGRGGGAIFIRAGQLTGSSGTLSASGGSASASNLDGGSGGGAGGSIYLRVIRTADCGALLATGGIGGNVNTLRVGPGGGGGGGRVLFQAEGGTCPISANGATAGVQLETSEPAYGAQPGKDVPPTVLPGGFVVPARPTILTPRNGAVTSNRRPPITGEALPAGVEVILYIDGIEAGRVTSDASGNYTFTPTTDLSDGPHTVQAVSEVLAVRSVRSEINTFTVDTTPPDTTIVSGPTGFTRQNTATFEFSATEPDVTYECNVNDAGFTACPSPFILNALAEGAYTLQVRARDAAGNVDESPATRSFRVTGADLALLGSGCSATGGDASLLLLGLGTLSALTRRRRRG